MQTIKSALINATQQLQSASPRVDAERLLTFLLKISRSYCFAHPEQELTVPQQEQYTVLIARRQQGEPIAYIVGQQYFWQSKFKVTADTLIPRPETEILVEQVLQLLPSDHAMRVADLGTGSGAIACSIALERPNWQIAATDISHEALVIAKENAQKLALNNIHFHQGSWCLGIMQQQFHAIVANPPYICEQDEHLYAGDLRFEPQSALISGPDGLDAIREIISNAADHLYNGGYLLLEHGYQQGKAVRELLLAHGFEKIHSLYDLAGHERVTMGVWQCATLS